MELTTKPDIYAPNMGDNGTYIDYIPTYSILQHGISCVCGSRKDKVFTSTSTFSNHIKTKSHQKWMESLNANRTNYYVELEKAKEVIQNQRIIIARLETELSNKSLTIDYLTKQLHTPNISNSYVVDNLLDFE
jgi:hypothetical protein